MLTLYKEVAVEVKPSPSSKRVEISIPRANGSYDRSKFSKKAERNDRLATDDKTYASEYLASASSIFFRQSQSYPRSFLWRVVAKQKILEISTADFSRNEHDSESKTIFAFEFQDRISPRGVSFCDSKDTNDFHVFILTQENEVFEICLKTDFFQGPQSVPQDTETWCSPLRASALSIDKAFNVHAATPYDLFVSFASGKVQHWKRDVASQSWSYVNYDEKTWGSSLLSIVSRKRHPDIDYDGTRLAYNTAHAMTKSGQYLFTACLNHTLRIWHLHSGRLVDSRDLLDQAREPQEHIPLNPAEPGYIQFLEAPNRHEQILLTYSPLNGGQVKLWRVRNALEEDVDLFSIEDMAPNSTLSLPDPDPTGNSIWSLAGLRVILDKRTKDWQIWILWRNNNYHKVYSLHFAFADLSNQWQNEWVTVAPVSSKAQGPDFVPSEPPDLISKWVEHILFPGRYSSAVVETALSQYATALEIKLSSALRKGPLKERLTAIVASKVTLQKYDDSTPNHDRFAADLDKQWRQFWRIIETMNEGRYAPLSLAADSLTGAVVLSMADVNGLVRECTNLELLLTNDGTAIGGIPHAVRSRWPYRKLTFTTQEAARTSVFLSAAVKFFNSFPPELLADFVQTLDDDLYTDSKVPTPNRIVNFFNEIDFANAIPDDVEREFMKDLLPMGSLESLQDGLYHAILQLVSEHKARHNRPHNVKTEFGVQITMTGLLDEILALRNLLLSMLAVVVFVDESDQFDTALFFDDLVSRLKTQERNLWLATHFRQQKTEDADPHTFVVSVMQDLYASATRPQSTESYPLPYLLVQHIRENLHFISGEGRVAPEDAAVFLQCNLLRNGDLELASDFLKFQPATPWSTYVKGRLHLALGEYKEASVCFQDASDSLARGKAIGDLKELSASLLSADEAAYFYGGLPLYLQHIVTLFEAQDAFVEAAQIASLTLEALEKEKAEPIPNFRQSVLLRLFNAELKCSKFDEAYQALVQFTDPVLQKTSTTELVDTMLESSKSLTDTTEVVREIQALPLAAHPHLAITIDQHVASLAKKQTSIPSAGGLWLSNSTVDYLSVLHALRLGKDDYRGAVSVLFDRLRIIQKSGRARSDPRATSLRHALLTLINAMTCVAEDEAYIIAEAKEDPRIRGRSTGLKRLRVGDATDDGPTKKRQRVIITLDDLRREYQQVLDRCSRIERGDFEFYGGNNDDGSDMDEDDDGTWEGSKLKIDPNRTSGTLRLTNGGVMDLS